MKRDKILLEKDRVQKQLWKEAGETAYGYVALIHKRAREIKRTGSTKKLWQCEKQFQHEYL